MSGFIFTKKNVRILAALALWVALALALIAGLALAQEPVLDCGRLDEFIRDGVTLFPEEREWYEENCEEEEEEIIYWPPLPTPTPRPPVETCSKLPPEIVVSGHRPFATQCQRLGADGVGNASLIALGILDALDVWAQVDTEMRICFRQRGSLKFLDATTAPRLVSDLAAEYTDGMTCGRISRAGTVVLLPVDAASAETSASQSLHEAISPSSPASCQLQTNGRLSLRTGPSEFYARLLSMPVGSRLEARARIGDWFMVNYRGQWGWASGAYLAASPGCEALGDERAIILPPTFEPPAPEAEEAMAGAEETIADGDMTDMAESVDEGPIGCELTAVYLINLRAGPGFEYDVLAEIAYQTRLTASAKSGDWFQVDYESLTGWVSRDYVFRWGSCYELGEADAVMPPSSMASSAPEAEVVMPVVVGTEPDADAVETVEPVDEALSGCQLTAVYLINLRSGPGLAYDVLAEIPYQTRLTATAKSGDWFKVDYESLAGWVSRDYVFRWGSCYELGEADDMRPRSLMAPSTPESDAPAEATEADETVMRAPEAVALTQCELRTGDVINLRQGPGLEYAVLAEIPIETILSARARSGDWFQVAYQAAPGWVHSEYVFRSGGCL